ncbi:MAG: hypothetical protein S4CHLAM123_09920 [Chlamydiales bacterium]|nr:hypothetical protein [Chlamydiales bacterium]
MYLIFLDTETSGLNPEKHRTLEIAYKVIDTLTERVIISYDAIISQTAEVWAEADPKSLEINGFTWEAVLRGKPEKSVASEISNDLGRIELGFKEAVFVCQNPSFDRAFFTQLISVDLQEHFNWPYHWLDLASMYWTLRLIKDKESAKTLVEQDLSKNRIAHYFGIEKEQQPHRAMNGVNHLIACYRALFASQVPG